MPIDSDPQAALIFVDLDGSLVATDTLWESLLLLFKRQPWAVFLAVAWLWRGKAYFKGRVAARIRLNPDYLPYRQNVLAFLEEERAQGKELVLATAADRSIAAAVADHLGIFAATLASDGVTNLAGQAKLRAIERQAAGRPFEYLGNSRADIPIWQASQRAHAVSSSPGLLNYLKTSVGVGRVFPVHRDIVAALPRALRVEQWLKNLLLFVPLVLAHKIGDGDLVLKGLLAFICFNFCASGGYVLNDLLDLESDRRHPSKRRRAFAAGTLSLKTGICLFPALIFLGIGTSLSSLPLIFTGALILYLGLSLAYSMYLKRAAVLDVLVLAYLYTHRILAGALAVAVSLSPWLLAFSIFFFLNLAYLKRYGELHLMERNDLGTKAPGRGYGTADKPLLRTFGTASGYISVLVLALYINSEKVLELYRRPAALWLVGPCLLYWITRLWLLADRGQMEDDPLVFTMRDRASYVVGLALLLILLVATF